MALSEWISQKYDHPHPQFQVALDGLKRVIHYKFVQSRERKKESDGFFGLFFFTLWTLSFMGNGSSPPKINGNQWSRTRDTVLFIPHILLSCENWAASFTHNATQPQRVSGVRFWRRLMWPQAEMKSEATAVRCARLVFKPGANTDLCYITRDAWLDRMQLDSDTQIRFFYICSSTLQDL